MKATDVVARGRARTAAETAELAEDDDFPVGLHEKDVDGVVGTHARVESGIDGSVSIEAADTLTGRCSGSTAESSEKAPDENLPVRLHDHGFHRAVDARIEGRCPVSRRR